MRNLEGFAEVVRLTIKAALAPEQARSARLDQALTEARAELSLLRERLAIVEARTTTAATPAEVEGDAPGTVT
jgi:hypothetical protein